MKAWILVIMFGITGWGAGGQREAVFDSKEDCYEALANMRISGQGQKSGDDDEQVVAYCKRGDAK